MVGAFNNVGSKQLHNILCCIAEAVTKKIIIYYNIITTGEIEDCENCVEAKLWKKNVNKYVPDKKKAKKSGE